jgi:hypothetical protein
VAVAFLYEGGPGEKAGPEGGAEAEGRPLVPLPWQPSWLRGRREFLKRCRCWPPLVWPLPRVGWGVGVGTTQAARRAACGRSHPPSSSHQRCRRRARPAVRSGYGPCCAPLRLIVPLF